MKYLLIIFASITIMILGAGCSGVFERSRPSQADYLNKYLPELNPQQIKKMDYTYRGSVGGFHSLARIEVADKKQVDAFWKLTKGMVLDFEGETRDMSIQLLKLQFTVAKDNKAQKKSIPQWVNVTYSKPIFIFKDSLENGRNRKFYLMKDESVFYLIVSGN